MDNKELKLVVLKSSEKLGKAIEGYIQYLRDDYSPLILKIKESVFSSGERKTELLETVHNTDIYIICDIGNYGITYKIRGYENRCSPYDNYKSVKDVVGAISGDANRITVVMPLLIDSRQHKREGREPLSCAQYLQELISIGVSRIITVDVHDRTVSSAIPYKGFNNLMPSSTMLKEFIIREKEIIDFDNLLVISPDQGATVRTEQIARQIGRPMGTFTKKRDLKNVVEGKNKIISHEYSGPELKGKDLLICDDIISSGDSVLDIAEFAKKKGANKVYFMASFALFTQGISRFIKAYNEGLFERIYTTNFTYIEPETLAQPWMQEVDCSMIMARLVSDINLEKSISEFLSAQDNPVYRLNGGKHY